MPSSSLNESAARMLHRWDKTQYPKIVYVETTNFCNARCSYCLYDRMERPVEYMSLGDFKLVVDAVKKRNGLQIGAMFCFGEPLADGTLFDKIRHARREGVLTPYLGLNTNCTFLTEEKFDDILATCNNITLSFVNTGDEFEKLTGLSWDVCYDNAIRFIKHRDKNKPRFNIQIGCNDVGGHNRKNVQYSFAGYKVNWARDAEIRWGSKVITGVIDRSIMYHSWTCDGHKGAIQIKPNGDCCFCAYDVIRNETKFANIFKDTWTTIEQSFKHRWREPSSLCLRCDFWWNYYQMVDGGWKRGLHIDSSWQNAYLVSIKDFWETQHEKQNIRYLSGFPGKRVWNYLNVKPKENQNVLNIGLGIGRETKELHALKVNVYGLDISQMAVDNVREYLIEGYTDPKQLPKNTFDLCVSNLVVQHMTDIDLILQMQCVLKALKPDGVFAIQYASPTKKELFAEGVFEQRQGLVRRTPEHMKRIVAMVGGEVVNESPTKYFDSKKATDDACWNGIVIKRV